MPFWSSLWFVGIAAGQDHWLLPALENLHTTLWYNKSQSSGKGLSGQIQLRSLGLVSEIHGVFSKRNIFNPGEAIKSNSHRLCCFESLFYFSDQKCNGGFACLIFIFFFQQSVVLGMNIIRPSGITLFKLCVCPHTDLYVLYVIQANK